MAGFFAIVSDFRASGALGGWLERIRTAKWPFQGRLLIALICHPSFLRSSFERHRAWLCNQLRIISFARLILPNRRGLNARINLLLIRQLVQPLSQITAIFQIRRGVRSGLADVLVIWRGIPIFVELKSRAGVASKAQKQIARNCCRPVLRGGWHEAHAPR